MEALGYAKDDPRLVTAKKAVDALLVVKEHEAYCQPCTSPVWDTGLAALAMMEAKNERESPMMAKCADWLLEREIKDVKGDWSWQKPDLAPGGWAFQYRNDHYPDVDDTAVVAIALDRMSDPRAKAAIQRAEAWILGMQSKNGGWGSFDVDNDKYYLNNIPFADHGALLDPPTADVSGRCLAMLAQLGYKKTHPAVARAIEYLKKEQEADGSWFGRWGTNYVYGTWSVLTALNAVGEDPRQPYIQKAVAWLKSRQRGDGGWGEDGATYRQERRAEVKESTPSQTSWAALALMAAGAIDDEAVARGVEYLLNAPREGPRWKEEWYTAVGFPRVFYLRYHGYAAYFPLWALARYRNLKRRNARTVSWGL
jgi:squalene-hopene/tetraprenyl-beta-curcumene cyclase